MIAKFRFGFSQKRAQSNTLAIRNFSLQCWKCSEVARDDNIFCENKKCNSILEIGKLKLDYFSLFDVPRKVNIDIGVLEHRYKDLQKHLHPDKFSTKSMEERRLSTAASSYANQAYQTLKSSMDRINYLLTTFYGIDVLSENAKSYNDPVLMLEMFELREKVAETPLQELHGVLNSTEDTFAMLCHQLEGELMRLKSASDTFKPSIKSKVGQIAIRMKYLSKIISEIHMKIGDETL